MQSKKANTLWVKLLTIKRLQNKCTSKQTNGKELQVLKVQKVF